MHALHHFSRINWDSLCLLMKSFSSFLRILYIPTKNQGHIYSNLPFRLPLKLPQSVLPGCGHLFYNSQSPVSAANWDQNCVGSNPSSTTHWQRCAGHSMFFGFLFFSEDWRQKYLLLVMLILQHREKNTSVPRTGQGLAPRTQERTCVKCHSPVFFFSSSAPPTSTNKAL